MERRSARLAANLHLRIGMRSRQAIGAMIVNTGLVAGLAGALIPLALKRFGYDPALGSGIIITALIDAFGFLSFLGLATLFLDYLI